jgi:hypothetical protein
MVARQTARPIESDRAFLLGGFDLVVIQTEDGFQNLAGVLAQQG